MADAEALALLERSPLVHLATTDAEGGPILRTVHGVVVDGALAFHGAPAGEKLAALGRPVVAGAEETIAVIPSYFFDPTLACPATTYYRSAQLHGVLEEVTDRHAKARVLAALMRKYQPEGGHAPIDADDPRCHSCVSTDSSSSGLRFWPNLPLPSIRAWPTRTTKIPSTCLR